MKRGFIELRALDDDEPFLCNIEHITYVSYPKDSKAEGAIIVVLERRKIHVREDYIAIRSVLNARIL